jgi:glutamate/tyrosine decarboxylase-like PLP-dependent enzyme
MLYTSAQAHSSVVRAAWIAGVPRANVRSIPVDAGYRMRADLLARAVKEDRDRGLLPFAVVGSAGTTNTAAVDPLHAIADIAAEFGVWFHVDAAYGGFAILTDRGRALLDGIERADSVTLDPHKWLFVPFECGCLLAREPRRLVDAFRILPEYLRDVETGARKSTSQTMASSSPVTHRAFKVWVSVNYFGLGAIRSAIDTGINLARHAEELMRADARFEILSPAQMGIVCFRVHPAGVDDPGELNRLNEEINQRVVSAAAISFLPRGWTAGSRSGSACSDSGPRGKT